MNRKRVGKSYLADVDVFHMRCCSHAAAVGCLYYLAARQIPEDLKLFFLVCSATPLGGPTT